MAQSLDQTNVFVKYLPSELDDEGLKDLFAPYGDIISSKVMVDHQSKTSLGYGFVRFALPEEAQLAINSLTGQRIQNKILLCKLSNSSSNIVTPELSTNLYIKPLPSNMTEESLRELFSEYGPIAASKVMVDKVTGESRQIGFVRFENQADATVALNTMNGRKLDGDQPGLIVKYAETEQQRTVRKTRTQAHSPPASPPPSMSHSPPASTATYYYTAPPMTMYSPIQYMSSVPYIAPYNYHHMAMVHPPNSGYNPMWRPPYVIAAEQTMSY